MSTSPEAVSFAAGQYATLGDRLQFESDQSWSVGAVIKVDAPAPGPSDGLPDGGASLVFGNTNGAPYHGYELWLNDNGDLRVRIMSSFLDNRYIDVAGSTNTADGRMHFIGATYDGSATAAGVTLYLDGAVEPSQILSDSLVGSSASNGPMIIGNQLNGWQDQFQLRGDMFSFLLSDTVRDTSYFQSDPIVAPTCDGNTRVALDFSAGSGLVLNDLSGHANDAMLTSATMWS